MPNWLRALPIQQLSVLIPVYITAALLALALVLPVPGMRWALRTRLGWTALAAGIGAVLGWALIWWTVDVQDMFGAPATAVVRAGATGAGAAAGIAIRNLVGTRWWRKVVAVIAVPVLIAAGGLVINRDVAYYPRLGDVFGITGVQRLPIASGAARGRPLAAWVPPANMPKTGTVGTVDIPGTVSRFSARQAWVYLPPAARVANPPQLPVVVTFAGQPGSPSDVFLAGNLQPTLDAIAAQHRGVAPIVVVPDQLGSYSANPMCVDSKLGRVETYITVDVRAWILGHLPVSADRRGWTAAGFSQGATCAVQFAAAKPAIFGSFIAVSPEIGPRSKSVAHTIAVGFGGSRSAYLAAQPIAVMRKTKHYPDTRAIYSVGALDQRYQPAYRKLAAASRSVGMQVSATLLPNLAHNWNTGRAGLADGLRRLASWWGLP